MKLNGVVCLARVNTDSPVLRWGKWNITKGQYRGWSPTVSSVPAKMYNIIFIMPNKVSIAILTSAMAQV